MGKRILVMDESKTIQLVLAMHFDRAGHRVIMCNTAQETVNVLAHLDAAPDMIFLAIDHQREACKVIAYLKEHETYIHTRCIAMVMQEEKAGIQLALTGSNVGYLVKPFEIQDALALFSASLAHAAPAGQVER